MSVESILNFRPLATIGSVLNEMELALDVVRRCQTRALEEGDPWTDEITLPLGLYVRHMEQMLAHGRILIENQRIVPAQEG